MNMLAIPYLFGRQAYYLAIFDYWPSGSNILQGELVPEGDGLEQGNIYSITSRPNLEGIPRLKLAQGGSHIVLRVD
jgi:hypothetical protein